MKQLLTILFALSGLSCSGQVQSSCIPSSFLLNHYDTEVKNLALKRIFDLKTGDTALIDIPQAFQDSIYSGLAAIHNLGNQLGADSIFQQYCVHIHDSWKTAEQIVNVIVDTSYSWTHNWLNYQIVSGIAPLDGLTNTYGYLVDNVYSSGGVFIVTLRTPQSINHLAVKDSLLKFPGVYGIYGSSYVGDGNVILYSKDDTAQYFDIYLKWGDCLAGCTSAKLWKYKVDTNCVVTLMASQVIGFDPFPTPVNCYLSVPGMHEMDDRSPTLFPNPAITHILISNLTGTVSYEVYSMEGKSLLSGTTDSEVDVAGLSSGIYYIYLRSQHRQYVRLFIKS